MKQRFKLYRRGNGNYYAEDIETGKQSSLRTSDKAEASRLLNAKNEAIYQPAFNTQIARAYLIAGDPGVTTRTWQFAMDALKASKQGSTVKNTSERYESAFKEEAFDTIRKLVIIETRPETILKTIHCGTMSTNIFMRRLHSFALGMGWLQWPIISYKQWPRIRFKARRAITAEETAKLIAVEKNEEWRAFLQLIWHIGAAQVDVAMLTADNIDWVNGIISYTRKKTGSLAMMRFGPEVEAILKNRPSSGPLFPHFFKISSADRATRFARRCKKLGITGVSLHSHRYAWAERAYEAGYPQRFAQAALGHKSAAVHQGYAKGAKVCIPSLEEYEQKTPPCPPAPTAPPTITQQPIITADAAQTNILPFPTSNSVETTGKPLTGEPLIVKTCEAKEAV